MKDFSRITQSYTIVRHAMEEERGRLRSARAITAHERLMDLNDQAYFILLFAQFEDRVTELCLNLVRKKKGAKSWKTRRLWDQFPTDRIESFRSALPFLRRVSLLIDKGTPHYAVIKSLYEDRNRIAHGDTTLARLYIPSVVLQIQRLTKDLTP
ncbi:MAG: hypothetical protein RLY93_15210 [Sumerlaeia bacterium]